MSRGRNFLPYGALQASSSVPHFARCAVIDHRSTPHRRGLALSGFYRCPREVFEMQKKSSRDGLYGIGFRVIGVPNGRPLF
jgi:hypothetical protein